MQEVGPWKKAENVDSWEARDGHRFCSFCGCLHPDEFLEMAESGEQIIPTDKSYKVYVRTMGTGVCSMCRGSGKMEDGRKCPVCQDGRAWSGPQLKAYFQHFSEEQAQRFTRLHNERRLIMAHPGHFYVKPFFWK